MRRNVLMPVFLLVMPLLSVQAQDGSTEFKIVGYYSLRAALTADVATVPYEQLTHINLAFLNPDSLGNFNQDLSDLAPFVDTAHEKGVKVLFSIGGGGRHPQYRRLLRDDNRPTLIENLVAQTTRFNVDGIDVDLEGSDIDVNYESFVVELAQSLRAHDKLITSAIAVYYKDQLSDRSLAQYDFVNIMVYDRTGPWRPERPGPHSTYADAVDDLEYFGVERGLPASKMTLGVPFYGYGFGTELTSEVITMNYDQIVGTFAGSEWVDHWHLPNGTIVYYNGIPTIRKKTVLAKEKASGIMIWQLLGDAPGHKSLLRAINAAAN